MFLDTAAMGLLPDRRILVSMRYTSRIGEIRTSFHYFNDEDDVNRLLEALRESA
ncbi:MAG: hypothetical protein ACRD21_20755 [Vicinamibacteria bacterium]